MIRNISIQIVEFWQKHKIIKSNNIESYYYGMELMLSTLLNMMLMIILSYSVIGQVLAFLQYSIAYIPLRMTAGGYHASSHWKCILYTQITFVGSILVICRIANKNLWGVIILWVLAGVIVFRFSPIEANNKPLGKLKKKKQRFNSWIIQSIIFVIVIVEMTCGMSKTENVLYIISANISVAISMILTKITNRMSKMY